MLVPLITPVRPAAFVNLRHYSELDSSIDLFIKDLGMQPLSLTIVLLLTLSAGFADAQGFLYSTDVWKQGIFNWSAAWRSALGFGLSIPCYWIAVRYLHDAGIVTPEIQALFWFVVTITGVAIAGGNFLGWNPVDKTVALLVLGGVFWLMARTGA